MGIDIYLNGYEAFKNRTAQLNAEFEQAVKDRDAATKAGMRLDGDTEGPEQKRVSAAYDAIYHGRNGYIRSSYNGGGLFRVLQEIYGFDVAAYLFPGKWDNDVPVDGAQFVGKVVNLMHVAATALSREKRELPWIDTFTELTGESAPDNSEEHVGGEAFGDKVFGLLSQAFANDIIIPGPNGPRRMLTGDHRWYLTDAMHELLEFGRLAQKLNAAGEQTFAYISY